MGNQNCPAAHDQTQVSHLQYVKRVYHHTADVAVLSAASLPPAVPTHASSPAVEVCEKQFLTYDDYKLIFATSHIFLNI